MRLLLVSESASLGGAPRVLLWICRGLVDSGAFQVSVALGRPGPAVDRFREMCDTYVFGDHLPGTLRRGLERRGLRNLWLRRLIGRLRPALVYHNTAADMGVMRTLRGSGRPVVGHVHSLHESEFARGSAYLELFAGYANRYIACSRFVQKRLIESLGVPPERVRTLYSGLHHGPATGSDRHPEVQAIRRRFGEENILVGGFGRAEFRKGIDLFLAAAKRLTADDREGRLRFLWVGDDSGGRSMMVRTMLEQARLGGLGDRLAILPQREDIAPYLAAVDIVAVTSRAETFSLTTLEACASGTPVVAFEEGGVPEILHGGGGILIPCFRVEAMAVAIRGLADDPERREVIGREGRRNVALNFDGEERLTDFRAVIAETIASAQQ